jgi:hypothetical protein
VAKTESDGRGRRRRVTEAQWDQVDWSLLNPEIADLVGCSRSLVTIARRSRGLPPGGPVFSVPLSR